MNKIEMFVHIIVLLGNNIRKSCIILTVYLEEYTITLNSLLQKGVYDTFKRDKDNAFIV